MGRCGPPGAGQEGNPNRRPGLRARALEASAHLHPGRSRRGRDPQPLDIDDDGDLILDNLDRSSSGRSAQIQGHHGATTAQIGTGDVLIERVTTGGVETQYPASLQYVFATVPALVSYSDGQGHSLTLTYPVAPTPELKDGFPVAAGPSGDVIVTLTYWRPQRSPIPGEACLADTPPCDWIDIGGLEYSMASGGVGCPKSAISESDPDLTGIDFPAPPGEPVAGGSETWPPIDRRARRTPSPSR